MSLAANAREQLPRGASDCSPRRIRPLADRYSIALRKREQHAADFQLLLPIADVCEKEIANFKSRFDVAFDIEIAAQVRFGQPDLGTGQEHFAERSGMI